MKQEPSSHPNFAPGSLYGQVNSGPPSICSKFGRLHASLLPPSMWADGSSLVLLGHTQAFKRFVQDVKGACLTILIPTLPEENHLKGPLLAFGVESADTRVILVPDPASLYVRQHYQEWVKTGQVSIDLITEGGKGGCRQTLSMAGVDADLKGWPCRTDWEPDPLERFRQVVDAFEAWSDGKKTVITSVLELQDTAAA